jgi:HSP20 family protein
MKEHSIYPGEYIPMPEDEALLQELKLPANDSTAKPLLNMDEFKDCYKVEMRIPGVTRDEIIIHVHDNFLSVVVLHKEPGNISRKKLQIHEFDSACLKRSILLPANADTAFINAEYEAGILRLYIPKTKHPAKNPHARIIVY